MERTKSQVELDEQRIMTMAEHYLLEQKRRFAEMGEKPLNAVALNEVEQLARGLEIYPDTPEAEQWWGKHIDAVLQGQRPDVPIKELHQYAKWLRKRVDIRAE